MMDTILQDLRYALRTFANRPGFTSLAILTLALGIGPTTAVYSFVEGVLLRPLPYEDAGRLVRIGWTWKKYYASRRIGVTPSLAEVRAWMAQSHSFERMSPHWGDSSVLTGLGEATRVSAYTVSSNLFPLLGVQPILGRGFTAEDDHQGNAPTAVLSYNFWETRFGGDPRALGRQLGEQRQARAAGR